MGKEIERKYLVNGFKIPENGGMEIKQGYLLRTKEKVVRVRTVVDDKQSLAFITIKGETKGIERDEYEYMIDFDEANEMIEKFCNLTINKTRYNIEYKNQLFEVDVFKGSNDGLILAEIELENENQKVDKPEWLGKDVSLESKYYNSNLLTNPYMMW